MIFPRPLIPGRLQRRYKRFLADVTLANGDAVTAHCANPGSMLGLAEADSPVWLSRSDNPKRKLPYSWELVESGATLVGINTSWPNTVVAEALEADAVPELSGYQTQRREVPYGANSRIDILLEDPGRPPCYLEVKSVTLSRRQGVAEFPDSVTKRGAKHLEELAQVVRDGGRAVMFFLAQRDDCPYFEVASDIDPHYDRALADALEEGVEALCYSCKVTPEAIELGQPMVLARPG